MQRFTYTEPRNSQEIAPEVPMSLCMGACNTTAPTSSGKMIDTEFYCDNCRVCVSCGEPAVMDEGNGLTCSPSRLIVNGVANDPELGPVPIYKTVCNGSLNDADAEAERINEAKDQLDWDNGAYRG